MVTQEQSFTLVRALGCKVTPYSSLCCIACRSALVCVVRLWIATEGVPPASLYTLDDRGIRGRYPTRITDAHYGIQGKRLCLEVFLILRAESFLPFS